MCFLGRRSSINKQKLISDIFNDYHRLTLLKNAVINYSGVRNNLEQRVHDEILRVLNIDTTAAALLREVAIYLRDIAIAGKLPEQHFFAEKKTVHFS